MRLTSTQLRALAVARSDSPVFTYQDRLTVEVQS